MSTHTNVQIITQGGKPAFAVVPYDQWIEMTGEKRVNVYIPHEVVGLQLKQELSLIAAWRRYKKLSQAELGDRLGISQAAVAQIESKESKPQKETLRKIAKALGIDVEQLTE